MKIKKGTVLHVSSGGLNKGGVGSVIFSIVENMHDKYDFGCVVFNVKCDEEQIFEKYGSLHRIACYPRKGKRDYLELLTRPLKLYLGIKKICKSNNYNVIHCHNQRDEWICLLAAKHANVLVRIAHTHVTNSPKKKSVLEKLYKSISPIMLNRVSTIKVGCSKLACEQFYKNDNFIVIPNAIDLMKYSLDNRKEHKGINFIHVGRFNYAKNQEFVLEVFSKLCKMINNVHLYLVGYGDERVTNNLHALVKDLEISEYVSIIPGDKEDVLDYYSISDYMIFPSRFEGFGIALLEAQAMGIKCYVSENIQKEVDVGLLDYLKIGDGSQYWADYIIQDINKKEKRVYDPEKLQLYSNEVICKQYEKLYYSERN